MRPAWGPPGSCRSQLGPLLPSWTLLSGMLFDHAYPVALLHYCIKAETKFSNVFLWMKMCGDNPLSEPVIASLLWHICATRPQWVNGKIARCITTKIRCSANCVQKSVKKLHWFSLCNGWLISLDSTLQWRHNDRDGFSNHQPHHCLLSRLYRCRSKKTLKLRVTGLCTRNSPVTGKFHAQRASNTENVFMTSSRAVDSFIFHCVASLVDYDLNRWSAKKRKSYWCHDMKTF